ncbi:MAG: hypothetical protein Kow00129_04650 [Thermoleophilia bacterium]
MTDESIQRDDILGRNECALILEQQGVFPGWSNIKLETFTDETGIPCVEIAGYNELEKEYGRPPAASWSIREFGDRFFPDQDIDLDKE